LFYINILKLKFIISQDSREDYLAEQNSLRLLEHGKWKTICYDSNSWNSLADNTRFSEHACIRSLHNSICNIIEKLPSLNRRKQNYIYLKHPLILRSKSTRSHCRIFSYNDDQPYDSDSFLELNKSTNNKSVNKYDKKQHQNIKHSINSDRPTHNSVKRLNYGVPKLQQSNIVNTFNISSLKIRNVGSSKNHQDLFKY